MLDYKPVVVVQRFHGYL